MKKLTKTLALTIALFCSGAMGAFAQDISETHLSAAYRAVDAINGTDAFDLVLPDVAQAIKAQLIANNPDIETEISLYVDEETLKLAARRGDLEREAAMAYARAFTEADLIAIADFYSTDAGKALISNGPIVAREINQAAGVWRRGIERDLLTNTSQRLADANLRQNNAPEEVAPAQETAPAQ